MEHLDDLNPARGILAGIALGGLAWAVVFALLGLPHLPAVFQALGELAAARRLLFPFLP